MSKTLTFDMNTFLNKNKKKKSMGREITDEMLNIFRKTLRGEIYLSREKKIIGKLKNPLYRKHFYKVVNDKFIEEKIKPTWYNVLLHRVLNTLTLSFYYIFNNKKWKEIQTILRIKDKVIELDTAATEYQNSKTYVQKINRISELNLIKEDELTEFISRDKE